MGQEHGGDLGQVHVAAAAEAENRVRPEGPARGRAFRGQFSDGSGSPPAKTSTATPPRASGATTVSTTPTCSQDRIGDDEDAARRQAADDVAELRRGVPAEDERSGGVKRPGGTHEDSPLDRRHNVDQ